MNNIILKTIEGDYFSSENCSGMGPANGFLREPPSGLITASRGALIMSEDDSEMEFRRENAFLIQQSLKYAEDMARVYEEERTKRKALEKAINELKEEVRARREAEAALRAIQQDLEKRVAERTDALTTANSRLQLEIYQRERTEEQITSSLREKEVLLSEVHHRVKNNLQIISSLLALQCDRVTDESVKGALMDSQGRIRSMALIHEQLYQSGNLSQIDFRQHVESLAQALLKTHADKTFSVTVKTSVDQAFLPVGLALPCSLIINELFTNCLKHAFYAGQQGEIQIDFRKEENNRYLLNVSDNGRGLSVDFDWGTMQSLGLRLVVNLAEVQLGGRLEVTCLGGTSFKIGFPGKEHQGVSA